jgi:microcystin degradation protein MlrC
MIDQRVERTLIATVASPDALKALADRGAEPGDAFDMEIGGRVDISAGDPVRISGTVLAVGTGTSGRASGGGLSWACIGFGDGNVLVISPFLTQILEPSELWAMGLKPGDFDIVAIKSRVHFRRGFDDSGFARTILLVEPPQPFLGTVRLDGLTYENLTLTNYYPYGQPTFTFQP